MRPDSICKGDRVEKDSYLGLSLIDGVTEMIQDLGSRDYRVFVVSAHPMPGPAALAELASKIETLGIQDLIDRFFVRNDYCKQPFLLLEDTRAIERITDLMYEPKG